MLWQVGVLVGIVWIADAAIRRWAWPQVRYALWMLVLLKLLIPPTLTSPASVTSQIPEAAKKVVSIRFNPSPEPITPVFSPEDVTNRTVNAFNHQKVEESVDGSGIAAGNAPELTVDGVPAEVPAAITPPAQAGEVAGPVLSWKAYLMLTWAAGVVVLAAWLVLRLSGLRKEHLNDKHAGQLPPRFNELLKAAAEKLNLKCLPRVIMTERVSSPAVFGVFRPVLLMPVTFRTMDPRDTEHILLHELAHIKRGDLWVHAVYMILQIIYWFNPLLWIIRRTLQNLRELCCDATVARLLKEDTVYYRQTLLETARGLLAEPVHPGLGLLGLLENSNWLVTRLQWLEKKTWKNRPLRIATVMVLVSVMAVCVLPMANRTQVDEEIQKLSLPYSVWMADIDGDDMKVLDLVSGEIITLEAVRNESEFLQKIKSTSQGDIFATYKADLKKPMVTFLRSAGLHGEPASNESIALSPIPMEIPWETVVTTQLGFKFRFRIVGADETACRIEYWPMIRKAKKAVSEQFRVTGIVTNAATGQPIAGAEVYDDGYNDGKARTFTDDAGRFVLRTANEEHRIAAKADGYAPQQKTLLTWPMANHRDFDFQLTAIPADISEAVLLPEHFESKTVLSLKTGQLVAQQLADSANEPYLEYCYSAGRQPQKRTVYNVPEEEIIVIAGKMDTAGGGFGKDYQAAQGMWQAQSADQLPDFKTSHAYRIAIQEAMNGSDGLAIARPLDMDWPYITAFRGDDGTHGVFEIMSVRDRKIHVRFRTIASGDAAAEAASASDPIKENTEPGTQNAEFSAVLPSGVTVELMGVCEVPDSGDYDNWRAPDGSSLEQRPFKRVKGSRQKYEDRKWYCFAFSVHGKNKFDSNFRQIAVNNNSGSGSGMMIDEKGENIYSNTLDHTLALLPADLDTTEIIFGFQGAPWKRLATAIDKPAEIRFEEKYFKVTPVQRQNGKLFVHAYEAFRENVKDNSIGFGLIIEKDGRETVKPLDVFPSNITDDDEKGIREEVYEIDLALYEDLSEDRIKGTCIQCFPFEYVTFKNVALRPGVKTDVQVQVKQQMDSQDVQSKIANLDESAEFTHEQAQKAVAAFWAQKTSTKTFTPLDWGELTDRDDGTKAIRCKFELTFWDKDEKQVSNSMFFFDKTGKVKDTLFLKPPAYAPVDDVPFEPNNVDLAPADKIELLKRMLAETEARYSAGMAGADEVLQAKINLLTAESEIADGPQKRAERLRQIAALYGEQVKLAEQQFAAGQTDQTKVNQLKLKVLEAEEAVLKAEAELPEASKP
jgi:beta-lactamase regulating signal transducer with metallopeptidase domain